MPRISTAINQWPDGNENAYGGFSATTQFVPVMGGIIIKYKKE